MYSGRRLYNIIIFYAVKPSKKIAHNKSRCGLSGSRRSTAEMGKYNTYQVYIICTEKHTRCIKYIIIIINFFSNPSPAHSAPLPSPNPSRFYRREINIYTYSRVLPSVFYIYIIMPTHYIYIYNIMMCSIYCDIIHCYLHRCISI